MFGHENMKNLKQNSQKQRKNIFDTGIKQKGIVDNDLILKEKVIEKDKLINKQTVKVGLREEDADYYDDIIDVDLYRDQVVTFENAPMVRLADELRIQRDGPTHLKGCTKKAARARWRFQQEERVKKAKKRVKQHQALLDKYNELKKQEKDRVEELHEETYFEANGVNAKRVAEKKPTIKEPEVLNMINKTLVDQAFYEIQSSYVETAKELKSVFSEYAIDDIQKEEERQKKQEKDRKKKQKKAAKHIEIQDEEDVLAQRDRLEDELLNIHDNQEVKKLATKVQSTEGGNAVDLKDLINLFGTVMQDSERPFTEIKTQQYIQEATQTVKIGKDQYRTDELEIDSNKITAVQDVSASRYTEICNNAKKVLVYAKNLRLGVPEELFSIIDVQDNILLKNDVIKFKPQENVKESYVLLMAATSKVLYAALNRFAGYYASDGLKNYNFSEDMSRQARNFDVFNINLMTNVRNIMDKTEAYAAEIRKNRIEVNESALPEEVKHDRNLRENIELVQGMQPVGKKKDKKGGKEKTEEKAEVKAEEKAEEKIEVKADPQWMEDKRAEEKRAAERARAQEKMYEEWRLLLSKDIRGTEEVDDKDMKKTPWVLSEYADKVFDIMKNNPDCRDLTGEDLKRYLIAINDNLRSNLFQLTNELPKTSVGKKFCYIPKLRDEFIETLKKDKFALLLRPDNFFRELLRNNSIVDDILDKPKYQAARNRQREIMKAINTALGTNFFTNAYHLKGLWADETIQALLLSEPQDKEQYVKLAEDEANKTIEKKLANKAVVHKDNIFKSTVNRLMSKSENYGVTDKAFQDALTKIRADVHNNVANIDKKIKIMGVCDTVRDVLKRNFFKKVGGELLLGYSDINEDILEYTIKNMMTFDGEAAEMQKTWDRKFARTGLPQRLSTKIERLVAAKINSNNHKDAYYLRPKGFRVSNDDKVKWEETNKKIDDAINDLKKLYSKKIKDFLKDFVKSEDLRKNVSNAARQYHNDTVMLTKTQWELLEEYFENSWVGTFQSSFTDGKYNEKEINDKLELLKLDLAKKFDAQLTLNYNKRQALGNDAAAIEDFNASLLTRDQFTEGLKNNAVIVQPKTIINVDLTKEIYEYPALKKIFKNKEDKNTFTEVLKEQLKDEKSALHQKYPYLADVRTIEQLGALSLIDYSQFFYDLKTNLTVYSEPLDPNAQPRLLLDEWRKSSQAGGDVYGIKKKLMADFLAGGMTDQLFAEKLTQYKIDAVRAEEVDRMRFDAILATEQKQSDSNIKFNYFGTQGALGTELNQTQRMKKMSYAQGLWYKLSESDLTKRTKYEESLANMVQVFLSNIEGKKDLVIQKEVQKLGAIFDNLKFVEVVKPGQAPYLELDQKSLNSLRNSGYFKNFAINEDDVEMLKAVQGIFKELAEEDTSEKKKTIADCMGEILMFGCGKEYFEAGAAGEKYFLDTDDTKYYNSIAKKSKEIFSRRLQVQQLLKFLNMDPVEKDKLLLKLKPILAGIEESDDPKVLNKNLRRYGVSSTRDLIERLNAMYGNGDQARQNRERSKQIGEIYKSRRDYIDTYGEGEEKGKFSIVREYMMKDPTLWNKIMTLTDEQFVEFMEDQNKRYGIGLNVFRGTDFGGSPQVNEFYIMTYFEHFQDREGWNKKDWFELIKGYHDAFYNSKIQKKSIKEMLNSVEKKMIKAKLDTEGNSSTSIMKLSYLISADPSSFNLLYNENDMFEALKRVDRQYLANMDTLRNTMVKVSMAQQSGKAFVENEEDDKLYKEVADIFNKGEMVAKQKQAQGSQKVIEQMQDDAQKGKVVTELDKAYADYNLLMQVMKQYVYSQSEKKFEATLIEKLREFKVAQGLERNENIYSDRNVLETKDVVRLELEIKKNQGKMLERKAFADLSEYAEKKELLGSVGLVAYNADPKLVANNLAAAKKFVEENVGGDFGEADEAFVRGLLVERAVAYGLKNEQGLKDTLKVEKQRLISLDKALRSEGGLQIEEDIRKAIIFAFAQNAQRTEKALDGTHKGDVKEILDELSDRESLISIPKPVSKIAQRDYDEFMEEMDVARFTMSKDKFKEICEKKRKYFDFVDACVDVITKKTDKLKVQVGLFEYFKKDIFEAIETENSREQFTQIVSDQLDKLIGDKTEGRNNLSADDIREITLNYLPDSSVLMQQISDKSITAEEKLFTSEKYTRLDIEKEISLSGNKDIIKKYNGLTVEEQKVFAMALTFQDIGITENETLTSNEALRDRDKEYQRELELQEDLAAYIYDQDFQPKIDYNVVMRRLMKTDRKTGLRRVSATMFEKAFNYTLFCMAKKNEMKPKDYTKLSDGRMTAEMGRLCEGKEKENQQVEDAINSKEYYGPESFKTFFEKIGKEDAKKDESIADIVKRFGEYSNVQMYMLLHVLQDRTALDFTTSHGKWDSFMLRGVKHVNEERRELLRNSFRNADGMDNKFMARLNRSMTHARYETAVETLFGYQLRDDVNLSGRSITANDFADNALQRATMVDWKLLRRAMDFVEEVEKENKVIQMSRQVVLHTTDANATNSNARTLGKEIENTLKEKTTNHFDFFSDFLIREARKNPQEALPLISAFAGMSDNERMLVIHSLKNRDILDVSKDNRFTTAIGMNENKYVNEVGRDQLADYYIDCLSVPGAKNVLATSQYDVRDALRSLVSTQLDDSKADDNLKTFEAYQEGTKVLNWKYFGTRSTGVDWNLFGNAIKFVKRTEDERKLLVGNAEAYRATGDINKYGRFMYNYQFMRKNLYRSGNRFTRFVGRRLRAEIELSIPGYGVGQRALMVALSPEMKNKMLSTGIVKPGVSKGAVTDYLGYAGTGGSSVGSMSSALAMVSKAASTGTAIAGEGIKQAASALAGLYNIGRSYSNLDKIKNPIPNKEELEKEAAKKRAEGHNVQTEAQKLVSDQTHLNKEWILNEVAGVAGRAANVNDILETVTTCVDVLTGSSFGIQAFTNVFVGGIRAVINETLHTARFITRIMYDKSMMDKYFSNEGPLGKEIQALKDENIQKIITDQNFRTTTGTRKILNDASLRRAETEFMGNMSNTELFRKAYGFKGFSEQAAYVGWNIVQTLLQSSSPFGADPAQFIRSSLLLAAIGCKDCIGKQDNDSAQRVYNKLMGQDIR